jgi:hypothetical protein
MTHLVFAMGRLLVLYMWNRWPFMGASDWEIVSFATRHIAKPLAVAPHRQIIEIYWNTGMQQNNIWSIPFVASTTEIFREVC